MQLQLDPNVGQQEILNFKKEIHIMTLQYSDIKKKQDQMMQQVERSVYKREAIQFKYQNKNMKNQ